LRRISEIEAEQTSKFEVSGPETEIFFVS
jgi:hypothetical protein